MSDSPIELFNHWFENAVKSSSKFSWALPEAMTLATVSDKKTPHARMVLLKGVSRGEFIFFTHYASPKGQNLAQNPNAALVFHWPWMTRQVRIEGKVKKTSRAESVNYFSTRPRGSQLGAWASRQSSVLAGRNELESELEKVAKRFQGKKNIPCPPGWGGYRLAPTRIEFWDGRPDRLHDRVLYTLPHGHSINAGHKRWKCQRLAP